MQERPDKKSDEDLSPSKEELDALLQDCLCSAFRVCGGPLCKSPHYSGEHGFY